jgi:hypothetical protein
MYSYFKMQKQMWTYAVTCHADWIRLLAGRGMNICHEIWSLSTVIQPHTVYNKQKELLQSCYWKLKKKSNIWSWPCSLDQWHNTCEVTNSTARRIQEPFHSFIHIPNFCRDNCKNLAKTSVSGCCGIMSKINVSQFMMLRLSFKLCNLTSWTLYPFSVHAVIFKFITNSCT